MLVTIPALANPFTTRFVITKTEDMTFKSNSVAMKSLKQTNMASMVGTDALQHALQLVWRLRVYSKESQVAPAKPLWFVKQALTVPKGTCQRIA